MAKKREYVKKHDDFAVGKVRKSCMIHPYQEKYIVKKGVNFSMLMRKLLRNHIEDGKKIPNALYKKIKEKFKIEQKMPCDLCEKKKPVIEWRNPNDSWVTTWVCKTCLEFALKFLEENEK
jgi:hypothetical protein